MKDSDKAKQEGMVNVDAGLKWIGNVKYYLNNHLWFGNVNCGIRPLVGQEKPRLCGPTPCYANEEDLDVVVRNEFTYGERAMEKHCHWLKS